LSEKSLFKPENFVDELSLNIKSIRREKKRRKTRKMKVHGKRFYEIYRNAILKRRASKNAI